MNPIGHSSRKRARIDSNLKRYYKPKLDLKLKFKEVITILALIMSVLVLFAVGKNSILAYFIDYKSINNYFIVEAEYIVSFDANTGTGTMENQRISYNVEDNLMLNTFTKTGYNFIGWNTRADGTGTSYIDEANITNLGDITLYAQWEEKVYDVTYFYGDEIFVGTNCLNTDIALFDNNNINKNFEISLNISNFEYISGQNQDRNVILCNQYERWKSVSRFCTFI